MWNEMAKKKHVVALGDNKTELKREDYEMQFCEIWIRYLVRKREIYKI